VRFRTYAKLNLHLRVGGRRRDGYHDIDTILCGIDLFDELEFGAPSEGIVTVDVSPGDGIDPATLPQPAENLVSIAAAALAERGAGDRRVAVKLEKNVPIGAGLGGGSANAAGALIALNEMWKLELDAAALSSIAQTIGSDVPYCLVGGTARATSRGERVTRVSVTTDMCFVLGVSKQPLSTHNVYAAWDKVGVSGPDSTAMTRALGAGDVEQVAKLLHNDLEPPAFSIRPELSDRKAAMTEAGALGSAMSGSGPTIFGVARDSNHAASIGASLQSTFDRVLIVSPHAVCVERLG
jgi:4-diphosphocytidyl-2-C-methyl-D-erythritol kinase